MMHCKSVSCLYQVAQVVDQRKAPCVLCSDFVFACKLQTIVKEGVELGMFKAPGSSSLGSTPTRKHSHNVTQMDSSIQLRVITRLACAIFRVFVTTISAYTCSRCLAAKVVLEAVSPALPQSNQRLQMQRTINCYSAVIGLPRQIA